MRLVGKFRSGVRAVRFAYQRVVRGWDDRAVWSLDHHLAETLGPQLVHMANVAHGWPSGGEWTYETWTAVLRRHGQALIAYAETDSFAPEPVYEAAREAIRWVAEHFGALWD